MPPRVVADTNLFVSAAISHLGNPFALLIAWRTDRLRLVTSREQLNELVRALRRPRLRRFGVTTPQVRSLIRRLTTRADLIVPHLPSPIPVRDPQDEHILALTVTAQADYLVTGDNDLLVLAGDPRLGDLKIVTVAAFLAILAEPPEAEAPP